MTFKTAMKKLKKLANNEYYSLRYEQTCHRDDRIEASIACYIHGYNWTNNFKTFEDALENMRQQIFDEEIKQELNPKINVKTISIKGTQTNEI